MAAWSKLELVVVTLGVAAWTASAQEALRSTSELYSTGKPPELLRRSDDYTFKSGDFRMLVTPSLAMDWSDNINLSKDHSLDDFIFKPLVQFDATYPISRRQELRMSAGIGYDYYTRHQEYSALRIVSGSEVALDVFIGDFLLNFHDQFEYIQDPAEQAAVTGSGRYGGFNNSAGLTTTWNLGDVFLTLGYDHRNFIASSSSFDYLNRSSELFLSRVGFRLYNEFTTGVEATGSLTSYDREVLNEGAGYSAGAFAEWKPGARFRTLARAGYVSYLFDQTSRVLKANDRDSWYASLYLGHKATEFFTYSLTTGHDLRLGTKTDAIEEWYVRPAVDWNIMEQLSASTYLSFEHGDEGSVSQVARPSETYDWFGWGLNLGHSFSKKFDVSLKYRLTLRASELASEEYGQNLVGLRFSYRMQ